MLNGGQCRGAGSKSLCCVSMLPNNLKMKTTTGYIRPLCWEVGSANCLIKTPRRGSIDHTTLTRLALADARLGAFVQGVLAFPISFFGSESRYLSSSPDQNGQTRAKHSEESHIPRNPYIPLAVVAADIFASDPVVSCWHQVVDMNMLKRCRYVGNARVLRWHREREHGLSLVGAVVFYLEPRQRLTVKRSGHYTSITSANSPIGVESTQVVTVCRKDGILESL